MKRIMTVMLAVIYITTGTISVMAGEPENNDAQKKESVSDSVKVQTSENTDEDRPKENSWRYLNGELIPQEDDATSNARAVTNAWKKVNGQFVNSLGKPIPGAKKKGMDISEYQGTINWDTVKNRSDIDFVIIRCSYGSGYKDRKWEYNVKECERLGIPYGVYIYSTATTVSAVEKEAENVKKMLEGHQPTYPVYFDMEENSVLNLGSSTIGKLANTFCSKISGAGYKVGIYASLYWWNSILTDRVFKNESWSKWVAQYSASCQYQSKYDMWQCTSSGKVNGVSTNVDINFWMSDEPVINQDADTAPNTSGVKYVEGYKSGNFYYNGYIKGVGATGNVSQGNTVGTIGKKQQLQSLTLYLDQSNKLAPSGTIQYATHIAKEGWKDWSDAGTTNGASTGTNGMEAVKIRLTGNLAKYYDIYYRAHVQGYGWLGWAKNGQAAGTSKIGYRMEGLQIRLVSKDAAAPGKNANYYTEKKKTATIAVKDQMHLRALAYASNTRYLILVDTTANRVGIYSGSVGKWNEVKKWVCTTGAKSTPTVKGTFTVQGKGKSFGSGYTCWYYTQFYGNYLFHSVLYKQGSMSVITDGRLGINASHGCVRLNINNAKWIYDNIPRGTKVVVY